MNDHAAAIRYPGADLGASGLGTFTASIAHEVSQPLCGIVTNASTCLRMLTSDPPDLQGACETLRRALRDANRASDVVTGLRTLFSSKPGRSELVDLNDTTLEAVGELKEALQANRVSVMIDLAPELPRVRGDRVQLQQVIINLLRNASDAMADVDDRPRQVIVRTRAEGEVAVRCTVEDCGRGFAVDAERLFEPFFSTKRGGMGIGLSVSRNIVESHRGSLWARANARFGATFGFSLPSGRSP